MADKVSVMPCVKCGASLDVTDQPFFAVVRCPACKAKQYVPARLGHFLLLELLGKGGMAAVYRAFDEKLNRQVAIKVMRRELGEDPKFVENFLREARAAAQLNHRNIVSVYSVDEKDGQPYIVMELLDGGRFDKMIAEQKEVDEIRALETALDVAEGLKAAQEVGLVHGDIKPANILFDRFGNAKITDFGLARFQRRKSKSGEIWGTPYYIAPEKIRTHTEDHRSDIYSLGATLYHALGGRPPFEGETATDVVLARLKEPPIRLSDIRPNIHPRTAEIVARMLEPDPMMRYPTYASLISDLKNQIRELRLGPPATAVAAKKTARRISPVWVGAIACMVLLALGIVFVILRHRKATVPPPPSPPPPIEAPPVVAPPPLPVETPTEPQKPTDIVRLPIQPFDDEQQRTIHAIAADLVRMDVASADRRWSAFVRALPPDHLGRPWGTVFYALAPWFAGDRAETERRLSALSELTIAPQPDGTPHPWVLPQAAARLILGRPSEPPPPGSYGDWPGWFSDFMRFLRAFERAQTGEIAEALALADQYLASSGGNPSWPYAFQPVAKAWKDQAASWEQFQSRMEERLRRGEAESVLRELEAWQKDPAASRWRPGLKERLEQARTAAERMREEREQARREAERRAREAKVQDELDRVDEARGAVLGLIQQRNFDAASSALKERLSGLTMPEAQEALRITLEACERMETLRRFVYRSVATTPFSGAQRELRGDIVAALPQGVVIRLMGGAGEVQRSWEVVTPYIFSEMCRFYLQRTSLPDKEKSELLLAWALYAYYSGAYSVASSVTAEALRMNRDLARVAQRLMPGVPPPP